MTDEEVHQSFAVGLDVGADGVGAGGGEACHHLSCSPVVVAVFEGDLAVALGIDVEEEDVAHELECPLEGLGRYTGDT